MLHPFPVSVSPLINFTVALVGTKAFLSLYCLIIKQQVGGGGTVGYAENSTFKKLYTKELRLVFFYIY